MNERRKRFLKILAIVLVLLPAGFLAFIAAERLMPINPLILPGFLLALLAGVTLWLILAVRSKMRRKWLAVIPLALLLLALLQRSAAFLLLGVGFHEPPVGRERSPSGKNEVIILSSRWIDVVYHAYPVRYGLFYQEQDNGLVSFENGDNGTYAIAWEGDDRAIVRFPGGKQVHGEKGGRDDAIVVTFQ